MAHAGRPAVRQGVHSIRKARGLVQNAHRRFAWQIVGTTVEWDEIRFDVRLLQRVPYEGISRMSTSLRRRHRDRVVRRGIGLTIESDFYATEAGRAHFADQLTSIRYCVQETCNFDCIFAYLTCTNYDFRYDIQKGLRPRRSIRTAMAHEINMYGEKTHLNAAPRHG